MDELVYYNATGKPEDKKNLTSFSYLSSLHSTKIYHQYRQSPSSPNGSVNLSIGHGSHLLVALPEKPILHVYLHGKESPEQIIPLPEILTCLTCYRDSEDPQKPTLLLGGSVSGRLYVWSINSGLLLAVKQPHYQPLTHIAAYSGFIATGSKDSRIVVHTLNTIFMHATGIDTDTNDKPFATITDNTLPITSLVFNRGLNNDVKLVSSSLDSTVRMYSLAAASGAELLTTIVATGPVTALAADPAFRACTSASPTARYEVCLSSESTQERRWSRPLAAWAGLSPSSRTSTTSRSSPATRTSTSLPQTSPSRS